MKRLRYFSATAAVVVADLVSKDLAFSHLLEKGLPEGQPTWVLGEWLGLALVKNRGITGGMGSSLGPGLLTFLTFAAAVGITLYLLRAKELTRSGGVGLALILGGAVGNFIDRIRFGKVVDFLDFYIGNYHWPAFNVAYSAISVGVFILLFHLLLKKMPE